MSPELTTNDRGQILGAQGQVKRSHPTQTTGEMSRNTGTLVCQTGGGGEPEGIWLFLPNFEGHLNI